MAVAGRGGAGVVVLVNGAAMAGGLGEADGTGDDGLEHLGTEVLAEILADLLAEAGAGIIHGEKDPKDGEFGVQAAFTDFFDQVEDFTHALQGEVLALDRDEDFFGGDEGAGHEEPDAGGTVEQDEVEGGIVFEWGKSLADTEEGFFQAGQFDLGPGEIQFGREDLEVGQTGGLKHFHGTGLSQKNRIEAPAGNAFQAETAGGVGLGIEVDQKDTATGLGRPGGKVDGGGRLADAAFLVHHSHDAHRTGNDGRGRVVERFRTGEP